jgi:hypothetical protein
LSIYIDKQDFTDFVYSEKEIEEKVFEMIHTFDDYARPDMHERFVDNIIDNPMSIGCRHRTTSTRIAMQSRRGIGNTNWAHIWAYTGYNKTDYPFFVSKMMDRYAFKANPDYKYYGLQIPEWRDTYCPSAHTYCTDRIK